MHVRGGVEGLDALLGAVPGSTAWNRLRWRAGRRGMKELDVLFARYLEHGWPTADERERRAFLELLDLQDPELARLLLAGTAAAPPDAAARGGASPPAADAALLTKLTDGRYAGL